MEVLKNAIKKTGRYEMRNQKSKDIKPIFLSNYSSAIEEFISKNIEKPINNLYRLEEKPIKKSLLIYKKEGDFKKFDGMFSPEELLNSDQKLIAKNDN